MRKTIFFVLFALGLLSAIFRMTAAEEKSKGKAEAIVLSINGKMYIKKSGSKKFDLAKKGQFLYEGDVIKTDKDSQAALIFVSGTNVKVNANTEFTISKKEIGKVGNELSMAHGELYSHVLHKGVSSFSVRTPVAVAAVRGTEFVTEVNGTGDYANERLSTLDGTVNLSNQFGGVDVPAGTYATVGAGKAPGKPQPLVNKPNWQENIKVSDKDASQLTKDLQNTSGPDQKTLKLELDTPSGHKTLNLKFKKSQ